jgi:hypothetical protein
LWEAARQRQSQGRHQAGNDVQAQQQDLQIAMSYNRGLDRDRDGTRLREEVTGRCGRGPKSV